jgi:hypothetical protein
VYDLLSARCQNCHDDSDSNDGLNLLTKAGAYTRLVGVKANGPRCDASHTLVVASDPAQSLLYQKLAGTSDCGLGMPSGPESGPFRPKPFTEEELAVVSGWIAAGAHDD